MWRRGEVLVFRPQKVCFVHRLLFFGVTRGVCLADFSEEQEVFCSLKFFFFQEWVLIQGSFVSRGFDSGEDVCFWLVVVCCWKEEC